MLLMDVVNREEETKGRLHGGLLLPHKESGGGSTDLCSVVSSDKTQGNSTQM